MRGAAGRFLLTCVLFVLALVLTFSLAGDGIVYLTYTLAAIVGAIAGACFVLVATADSGPCEDCPKLWKDA